MNFHNQLWLRVATEIAEKLKQPASPPHIELPTHLWTRVNRYHGQLRMAAQRNWHVAQQQRQTDLSQTLETLQQELTTLVSKLQTPAVTFRASAREILNDLVSLQEEFSSLEIDRGEQEIVVQTESIELEEVFLGSFEIRLCYARIGSNHAPDYRVIALDPHPASTNSEVTHPHVQDEIVCEGEAAQPIRTALSQGRIFDVFKIIDNVLKTYNSHSPYVSLEEWYGIACADCGTSTCEDDRSTCEQCEVSLCGDCVMCCTDCDGVFCCECTERCEACEDRICRSCQKACSSCAHAHCCYCLDENERCETCHDNETTTAETPKNSITTSHAEIQPDRLGPVAVSA